MYSKENKKLIDKLLNDKKFQEIVNQDLGHVQNVKVDWENNQIIFQGESLGKILKIDEILEVLKTQIQ